MSGGVLSQFSALNPGSDLWILPDLSSSPWTAKLDWYLNFQICKSSRHQRPELANFVSTVLEETDLERFQLSLPSSAPLMIASQNLLPNKWVVVLPWESDLTAWADKAFEIWKKLKEPSLRIFLPPGQSAGTFQSAWQTHDSVQDFTVVLD